MVAPVIEPAPEPFSLSRWVTAQKQVYPGWAGAAAELEACAAQWRPNTGGLSGPLLDELVNRRPRLVPVGSFAGGARGFSSPKREKEWRSLFEGTVPKPEPAAGLLIRFYIAGVEWVPHPYAPPNWALMSFHAFSQSVVPNRLAYMLCLQWARQNSAELTRRVALRLSAFPVQVAARYSRHGGKALDYAIVALALPHGAEVIVKAELQWRARWRGQEELAQLVKRLYPDAIVEYRPDWLLRQHLDVFIPSLKVAIEYQGQQHYRAVGCFGGSKALRTNRERDRRKAAACERAGIVLIEWKYSELVSEFTLRKKLAAAGLFLASDH